MSWPGSRLSCWAAGLFPENHPALSLNTWAMRGRRAPRLPLRGAETGVRWVPRCGGHLFPPGPAHLHSEREPRGGPRFSPSGVPSPQKALEVHRPWGGSWGLGLRLAPWVPEADGTPVLTHPGPAVTAPGGLRPSHSCKGRAAAGRERWEWVRVGRGSYIFPTPPASA